MIIISHHYLCQCQFYFIYINIMDLKRHILIFFFIFMLLGEERGETLIRIRDNYWERSEVFDLKVTLK